MCYFFLNCAIPRALQQMLKQVQHDSGKRDL